MMNRIIRWVAAHFEAYRKREKWPFLWRITLEGLLVPIVILLPLIVLFELPHRVVDLGQPLRFLIGAVVIAPFLETLIFQAFPVMIARRCGVGFRGQVLAGLVFFAAVHFTLGIAAGIGAGVLSGFYLAFTYAHWRQASFRVAFWLTACSHALHNLVVCTIGLVVEG